MKTIFCIFALLLLINSTIGQSNPCQDYQLAVIPYTDPAECDLYYVCVFYVAYLYQCDPGKVFFAQPGTNPPFGECEEGYLDTCSRVTTTSTTTTTTPPPTTSTTMGIATTTLAPPGGIPDNICDGIIFRRIPYPEDCSKYISCILGRAHVSSCPRNQIFLENWSVCLRGNRETCEFCIFC